MFNVAEFWSGVHRSLFPYLDEVLPPGSAERVQDLALVLEVVRIEELVLPNSERRGGRHDRRAMARALIAKACYNFPTTEALWERLRADEALRRICGWERRKRVPSLATFSRAFAEFAAAGLPDRVHGVLVARYGEDTLFWEVCRDSSAIEAREQPKPPEMKRAPAAIRRRGRPRKGEVRPPPEPSRLERQYAASPEETTALLDELPKTCDVGYKPNSKGELEHWTGYKFHVDVGDTGLPLLAVTTSASLHDSQVAIPMARTTAGRVGSLYDLMDAGYDAATIRQTSYDLGHVPIIPTNRRRGPKPPPLEPDRARRYAHRSASERFNSDLKDNHGGRTVRVRGHPKVHAHLMFGLLVIFAEVALGWTT